MAGNYPDVPGHRFAYDKDGTVVEYFVNGQPQGVSQTTMNYMNNDISDDWTDVDFGGVLVFLFPELRTITGYYSLGAGGYGTYFNSVQWSADTTTGIDGTWTNIPSWQHDISGVLRPAYRTSIKTGGMPITGVRAIKGSLVPGRYDFDGFGINAMHFYGTITGVNNRLELWHPTLDQIVDPAYFDWGNVTRGYTYTRQFRVKNVGSLTANSAATNLETILDTAPPVLAQHMLSLDGSTWTNSVALGNLAPGAISSIVTIRYIVPADADLSVYTLRIKSAPASWS